MMLATAVTPLESTVHGVDWNTPAQIAARVRAEYREMPGLKLTLGQAARVFGLDVGETAHVLKTLLDEGFLTCDPRGAFRRRDIAFGIARRTRSSGAAA